MGADEDGKGGGISGGKVPDFRDGIGKFRGDDGDTIGEVGIKVLPGGGEGAVIDGFRVAVLFGEGGFEGGRGDEFANENDLIILSEDLIIPI